MCSFHIRLYGLSRISAVIYNIFEAFCMNVLIFEALGVYSIFTSEYTTKGFIKNKNV